MNGFRFRPNQSLNLYFIENCVLSGNLVAAGHFSDGFEVQGAWSD